MVCQASGRADVGIAGQGERTEGLRSCGVPRFVAGGVHTSGLALARRIVADDQLAEDVVRKAFVAYWRDPAAFDFARGSSDRWFLAMVHHKAVEAVRREECPRRRLGADGVVGVVRGAAVGAGAGHRGGLTQREIAVRAGFRWARGSAGRRPRWRPPGGRPDGGAAHRAGRAGGGGAGVLGELQQINPAAGGPGRAARGFVWAAACRDALALCAATGRELFLTGAGWPAQRTVVEVTESLVQAESARSVPADAVDAR